MKLNKIAVAVTAAMASHAYALAPSVTPDVVFQISGATAADNDTHVSPQRVPRHVQVRELRVHFEHAGNRHSALAADAVPAQVQTHELHVLRHGRGQGGATGGAEVVVGQDERQQRLVVRHRRREQRHLRVIEPVVGQVERAQVAAHRARRRRREEGGERAHGAVVEHRRRPRECVKGPI